MTLDEPAPAHNPLGYRVNPLPEPRLPPALPWWRRLFFFLDWLDARRARARAAAAYEEHVAELRRRRDRAWGFWYVRTSHATDEALAAHRELRLREADLERACAEVAA